MRLRNYLILFGSLLSILFSLGISITGIVISQINSVNFYNVSDNTNNKIQKCYTGFREADLGFGVTFGVCVFVLVILNIIILTLFDEGKINDDEFWHPYIFMAIVFYCLLLISVIVMGVILFDPDCYIYYYVLNTNQVWITLCVMFGLCVGTLGLSLIGLIIAIIVAACKDPC